MSKRSETVPGIPGLYRHDDYNDDNPDAIWREWKAAYAAVVDTDENYNQTAAYATVRHLRELAQEIGKLKRKAERGKGPLLDDGDPRVLALIEASTRHLRWLASVGA